MAQHRRITASDVGQFIDRLESVGFHGTVEQLEELLWLLPRIDSFLVKHDRTDMARELRRAFDDMKDRMDF